jgi:transglutaminase-like putative cysteine protease
MSMENSNENTLPAGRPNRLKLAIHWLMLIVFTVTSVAPSAHAFAGTGVGVFDQPGGGAGVDPANDEDARYRAFFERAREEAGAVAGKADKYGRLPAAARQEEARAGLDSLIDELDSIEQAIDEEFEETGELVRSKKLPKTIRARHDAAFAGIKSEFDAVRRDIRQVQKERDAKKRKSLAEGLYRRLDAPRFERSQQEFDPSALPNSSLAPNKDNKPRVTEDEYIASGLVGNPLRRVAQASGYTYGNLPGASDPAFLAATDEVVLTADIRAKATELGNEPVRIYEWVRNNVQWAPTWGAIQDASHTLSSQRGNAFDIASLTIALLRAAGYPARYVHGTIDVPEAQFRNWVGGFQNINAAMEYASSGGVPLGPVTAAGRVTKVRMEHIWVEAAIDFHPSRGTKNRDADSWVAMDPSYKQLDVLPGLNIAQVTGFDVNASTTAYLNSGSSNESEGWSTGFNSSILENARRQAATQLGSYVALNLPNATMGDVLGGLSIQVVASQALPSGLPNKVIATGSRYAVIPASLQQRITFAFGKDLTGEPIDPRTFSWSTLNGRNVILSFRPATPDDEAALRSLLPPGEVYNPSQLPASIPAYLVRVIPEIKLDDTVLMSGPSMTLGTDMNFVFNPTFAGRDTKSFSYKLPAGSYLAVAVVAGSVAPLRLSQSEARMQASRAIIESGSTQGLSKDRLLGDMFNSGMLDYYAQYAALGDFSQRRFNGRFDLAAGLGSFGFEPRVSYTFGVPRSVSGGGAVMNVPIVNIVGADSLDRTATVDQTFQLGILSSALEHTIPESLFANGEQSGAEAISAVKALAKASSAGQRIYRITPANQAQALPLIQHNAATMAEIRSALAAGKTVLTHTSAVSIPGWSGAGYVILDTETGSAAWKIAGGANGGAFLFAGAMLLIVAAIAFFPPLAILGVAAFPIIAALVVAGLHLLLIGALFHPEALFDGCAGLYAAEYALGILGLPLFAVAGISAQALGWVLGLSDLAINVADDVFCEP